MMTSINVRLPSIPDPYSRSIKPQDICQIRLCGEMSVRHCPEARICTSDHDPATSQQPQVNIQDIRCGSNLYVGVGAFGDGLIESSEESCYRIARDRLGVGL